MSQDTFVEHFDIDDLTALPPHLRKVYKNPYRSFGLDPAETNTKEVRDAFRKALLGFCPQFMGMQKSTLTVEQLVFSYHLLRKTIRGPAQNLKEQMANTRYMQMEAEDILPTLRPIGRSRPPNDQLRKELYLAREKLDMKLAAPPQESDFKCPPEYRGFKNLNVHFHEVKEDRSFWGSSETVYVFTVSYCMRKHRVEKTLEDFKTLHGSMSGEQVQIPDFPEMPTTWLGFNVLTDEEFGEQLAEYIIQNHNSLTSFGVFSPRMLKFLNIDFERVQSEEEGAILSVLDNQVPIQDACYYIIDEKWLARWRRFAMGRGPRRYLPPGRVTNEWLVEQYTSPGRHLLRKAEHYRCVNYNVWAFYMMVHTGGPTISRVDQDLYGDHALSYLQAVVLVQGRVRIYLARKELRRLYMEKFSRSIVARGILAGEMMQQNKSIVHAQIQEARRRRLDSKVRQAVVITQKLWRKKAKTVPEENLARSRADQAIFGRVRAAGGEGAVKSEDGIVVSDVHPIVNIGNTSTYTVVIDEDEFMGRIPFEIKKIPWSEQSIIATEPSQPAADPLRFIPGSKILTINSLPTSSMTYAEFKLKLTTLPWPIKFELEKPVPQDKLVTWSKLGMIQDDGLLYSAFKMFLTREMCLVRHRLVESSTLANPLAGLKLIRKPELTRIAISDTHFYYRRKFDPKKSESDHWVNFPLFNIKFFTGGEDLDLPSSIHKGAVFSISTHDKDYTFEVPTVKKLNRLLYKEEKKKEAKKRPEALTAGPDAPATHERNVVLESLSKQIAIRYSKKDEDDQHAEASKQGALMVKCFKHMVKELRNQQTYVDVDGVPTMRKQPKTSLRKVLKA